MLWAGIAAINAGGSLFGWLISPTAGDDELLGRTGSIVMAALAAAVALVALVAAAVARRSTPLVRWAVVMPAGIVGGALGAVALGSLLSGSGFWALLFPAMGGLLVVAWYLGRVGIVPPR
jgi:hypothetical protein